MIHFLHQTHDFLAPIAHGLGWIALGYILTAPAITLAAFIVNIVMAED